MEEKFSPSPREELTTSGEELEGLIGKTIEINPAFLLKEKRLYTTQHWVNEYKLIEALNGDIDNDDFPSGWISLDKKGNTIYIVGDGNHRIGLACINGGEIPFRVAGLWIYDKRPQYQFNIIVKKIRDMGIGLSK